MSFHVDQLVSSVRLPDQLLLVLLRMPTESLIYTLIKRPDMERIVVISTFNLHVQRRYLFNILNFTLFFIYDICA